MAMLRPIHFFSFATLLIAKAMAKEWCSSPTIIKAGPSFKIKGIIIRFIPTSHAKTGVPMFIIVVGATTTN
jgi:hypothetical protein